MVRTVHTSSARARSARADLCPAELAIAIYVLLAKPLPFGLAAGAMPSRFHAVVSIGSKRVTLRGGWRAGGGCGVWAVCVVKPQGAARLAALASFHLTPRGG